MSIETQWSDDEVKVTIHRKEPSGEWSEHVVAHFEDSGNGMEGEIYEGTTTRMQSEQLIKIAQFLLEKAAERMDWERNASYNEGVAARAKAPTPAPEEK